MAKRNKKELTIALYSLYCFFVEVIYHPGRNEIVKLRTFKNRDGLEPYLAGINIEVLTP